MKQETVTLPSGGTVTIQEIGPAGLVRVMRAIPTVGQRPGSVGAPAVSPVDDVQFLIDLVCACSVEPKITVETIDDHLSLADFNVVGEAARRLCGFAEATAEVDPTSPSETPS